MSKITLEQVEATLLEKNVDQQIVQSVLHDLEQTIKEEKDEKAANKLPKVKNELIVYLNDPDNKLKDLEFDAWIASYKEGDDAGTVLQKIRDAAKEQNESSSKKKYTLDNLGEVFQNLKNKFLKSKNVKVLTKESVRVVRVNGRVF